MTPVGSSNNPSRRTISNQTTAKKLPKTGERYTPSYLITGISILFLATALLFFSRKKVK
jgi:LPXTG-motif cell wall-anchored protein